MGVAVGRAVRTSIVAINVIDLFLSMAIWGTTTTVRLAGSDELVPEAVQGPRRAVHRAGDAGVYLTYATFTKKFTDYEEVTLETSRSAASCRCAAT